MGRFVHQMAVLEERSRSAEELALSWHHGWLEPMVYAKHHQRKESDQFINTLTEV